MSREFAGMSRTYGGVQKVFGGLQKGPAERGHVENRQKVSKSFSTLFDNFQNTSKIVEKCQKYVRHFSTIFARHHSSGPAPF